MSRFYARLQTVFILLKRILKLKIIFALYYISGLKINIVYRSRPNKLRPNSIHNNKSTYFAVLSHVQKRLTPDYVTVT